MRGTATAYDGSSRPATSGSIAATISWKTRPVSQSSRAEAQARAMFTVVVVCSPP